MSAEAPRELVPVQEVLPATPGGRPPHEPTEETRAAVFRKARIGIPKTGIAAALRICTVTLNKYYAAELEEGRAQGLDEIAEAAHNKATVLGDSALLQMLLRARLEYSTETVQRHIHEGNAQAPIMISAIRTFSDDAELPPGA